MHGAERAVQHPRRRPHPRRPGVAPPLLDADGFVGPTVRKGGRALTNLGNPVYRQGEFEEARRLYERALERALDHDPSQPEARYNLGNLLEYLGETELAVAELRRVCAAAPEFADAHYNLGIAAA